MVIFSDMPSLLTQVNVKDTQFAGGAKGDNVTDDTAAFQAALDYLKANGGGTLDIPPGEYVISEQLEFICTPTTYPGDAEPALAIRGAGTGWAWYPTRPGGTTTIRSTMGSPGHVFHISKIYTFAISDLDILQDGEVTAHADHAAIYTDDIYMTFINRMYIWGTGGKPQFVSAFHGVAGRTGSCMIDQVYWASGDQAIWFDGGAGFTVSNSWVTHNWGTGGYGCIRMDRATTPYTGGPATLQVDNVVTLQGDWGLHCGGTGNSPIFIYCNNFQINRPHAGGIYLQSGSQFWGNYLWVSDSGISPASNMTGILFDTDYIGWAYIVNSNIQGFSNHGIHIKGGKGFVISATSFGSAGFASANTYDDLHIASAVSHVTVDGCHFDVDPYNELAGTPARSAIYIEPGAHDINITGCQAPLSGYGTAAIVDLSGNAVRHGNIGLGAKQVQTAGSESAVTQNTWTNLSRPITIPKYDPQAYRAYRITAYGSGRQATGTRVDLGLRLYFGTTQIGYTVIDGPTGGVPAGGNFSWRVTYDVIITTGGASGVCNSNATFAYNPASFKASPSTSAFGTNTHQGATFNGTVDNTFVIQARWASTVGAPTLTCHGTVFESLTNVPTPS